MFFSWWSETIKHLFGSAWNLRNLMNRLDRLDSWHQKQVIWYNKRNKMPQMLPEFVGVLRLKHAFRIEHDGLIWCLSKLQIQITCWLHDKRFNLQKAYIDTKNCHIQSRSHIFQAHHFGYPALRFRVCTSNSNSIAHDKLTSIPTAVYWVPRFLCRIDSASDLRNADVDRSDPYCLVEAGYYQRYSDASSNVKCYIIYMITKYD